MPGALVHQRISKVTAYSDLAIGKTLLSMPATASRDFHRWRTNQILMATYLMAKQPNDSKTMERAATAYGKLNRVDYEDEQAIPLDQILVQPSRPPTTREHNSKTINRLPPTINIHNNHIHALSTFGVSPVNQRIKMIATKIPAENADRKG